jgi:hypothetical protein
MLSIVMKTFKQKLEAFRDSVFNHKNPERYGFMRPIRHNKRTYVLKAKLREYQFVDWILEHDNQIVAWTNSSEQFINFKEPQCIVSNQEPSTQK